MFSLPGELPVIKLACLSHTVGYSGVLYAPHVYAEAALLMSAERSTVWEPGLRPSKVIDVVDSLPSKPGSRLRMPGKHTYKDGSGAVLKWSLDLRDPITAVPTPPLPSLRLSMDKESVDSIRDVMHVPKSTVEGLQSFEPSELRPECELGEKCELSDPSHFLLFQHTSISSSPLQHNDPDEDLGTILIVHLPGSIASAAPPPIRDEPKESIYLDAWDSETDELDLERLGLSTDLWGDDVDALGDARGCSDDKTTPSRDRQVDASPPDRPSGYTTPASSHIDAATVSSSRDRISTAEEELGMGLTVEIPGEEGFRIPATGHSWVATAPSKPRTPDDAPFCHSQPTKNLPSCAHRTPVGCHPTDYQHPPHSGVQPTSPRLRMRRSRKSKHSPRAARSSNGAFPGVPHHDCSPFPGVRHHEIAQELSLSHLPASAGCSTMDSRSDGDSASLAVNCSGNGETVGANENESLVWKRGPPMTEEEKAEYKSFMKRRYQVEQQLLEERRMKKKEVRECVGTSPPRACETDTRISVGGAALGPASKGRAFGISWVLGVTARESANESAAPIESVGDSVCDVMSIERGASILAEAEELLDFRLTTVDMHLDDLDGVDGGWDDSSPADHAALAPLGDPAYDLLAFVEDMQ